MVCPVNANGCLNWSPTFSSLTETPDLCEAAASKADVTELAVVFLDVCPVAAVPTTSSGTTSAATAIERAERAPRTLQRWLNIVSPNVFQVPERAGNPPNSRPILGRNPQQETHTNPARPQDAQ